MLLRPLWDNGDTQRWPLKLAELGASTTQTLPRELSRSSSVALNTKTRRQG